MSFFTSVEMLPEDPILSLPIHFAADTHENKVNLGIGSYQDGQGKPAVFSCVKEAEKILLDQNLNKQYPPIDGNPNFNNVITQLLFGEASQNYSNGEIFTMQTVGGTGALRIGSEFLARNRKMSIYVPDPTWPNHRPVFKYAEMEIHSYPYYHRVAHDLDFDGMCSSINRVPSPGIILFHACCHNPTGIDPTVEQWQELSQLLKKKKLLPFFDVAYQGLGLGVEEDVYPIRLFLEQGHEMLIASSCSKNFGLYGERVGALTIVTQSPKIAQRVLSQCKQIVRSSYSMPPLHGGRIVTTVLQSSKLTEEWKQELASMRKRIKTMRHELVVGLENAGVKKDVKFFETQKGIFSYTGLTPSQVQKLREDYGIYTAAHGRINIAGLNDKNIQYVVSALAQVLES